MYLGLIRKELNHFKNLSEKSRIVLQTGFIYNLANPLLGTFINALIWRESKDIYVFMIYYFSMFITLPIGYLLNNKLLSKFNINKLYIFGFSLNALSVGIIMFFSSINLFSLIVFGILMGLGYSFYWSNYNYFVQTITENNNRNYFNSLAYFINTIPGVLVPLLIGYFIVAGEELNLYSIKFAYSVLGLILFVLIYLMMLAIKKADFKNPKIIHPYVNKITRTLTQTRKFIILSGIYSGTTFFIPSILVLKILGNEDTLGSISSISTLIGAIIIYIIGRRIIPKQRIRLRTLGLFINLIGALALFINFTSIGIFYFFIFSAISIPMLSISYSTLCQRAIDLAIEETKSNLFAYIFDQELFMNIGRIIALIIILLIFLVFDENFTLRSIVLTAGLINLFSLIFAKDINK